MKPLIVKTFETIRCGYCGWKLGHYEAKERRVEKTTCKGCLTKWEISFFRRTSNGLVGSVEWEASTR